MTPGAAGLKVVGDKIAGTGIIVGRVRRVAGRGRGEKEGWSVSYWVQKRDIWLEKRPARQSNDGLKINK